MLLNVSRVFLPNHEHKTASLETTRGACRDAAPHGHIGRLEWFLCYRLSKGINGYGQFSHKFFRGSTSRQIPYLLLIKSPLLY